MVVKVQHCWNGHRLFFRALVCGGLRVYAESWTRKTASEMLDILAVEIPNVDRSSIRFKHV